MKIPDVSANGKRIGLSESRLPEQSGSLLRPECAKELFGGPGPLVSAIYYEIQSSDSDLFFQNASSEEKAPLLNLANGLKAFVQSEERHSTADVDALKNAWLTYLDSTLEAKTRRRLAELTQTGDQNPYERILREACQDRFDWLYAYGQPLGICEIETAKYWFRQPEEVLAGMGAKIVDALLHGFISQSRDRRGRRHVRFIYQIGQEALAQQVLWKLEERGLRAIVARPRCLNDLGQAAIDHRHDRTAFYDEQLAERLWQSEQAAHQDALPILEDTCGMIGIDQFGAKPAPLYPSDSVLQPTERQLELASRLNQKIRSLEASVVKPSEISFCRVAFPNACLGDEFEPVFKSFLAINMEESEPYEHIQQVLIDALDACVGARLRGRNGNETDLHISFWPLTDATRETLFLNCGGDLNIPYGEIFTTPKLGGTTGLYHVEEVFLKGHVFHQLRLRFQDGYVVDASCAEGIEYIKAHLFDPAHAITMGEFAIGTNTRVGALARRFNLTERLPILITEKMGPHIALGDPCFTGAEDAPIHNLFDGKEMICRQNERTSKRFEDGGDVYYGRHIDITLPYDKVASLSGQLSDGSEVNLIAGGKFVLQGSEGLNESLEF